jgi:hypothetical protein
VDDGSYCIVEFQLGVPQMGDVNSSIISLCHVEYGKMGKHGFCDIPICRNIHMGTWGEMIAEGCFFF